MALDPDLAGVLQAVFNEAGQNLATTTVVAAAATNPGVDQATVWRKAYDPATNTLRIIYV